MSSRAPIASERGELGRLGDMVICSNGGPPIPVSQIARIQYEHEEPISGGATAT